MTEQNERCYAVEQLKTLQGSIADLTQSMVLRRAGWRSTGIQTWPRPGIPLPNCKG